MPRWAASMISNMLECMMAWVWVYEPPTESGSFSRIGALLPASNMMIRLGAEVRWASMAAARGIPTPITAILLSSSWCAAAQIISSFKLKRPSISAIDLLLPPFQGFHGSQLGQAALAADQGQVFLKIAGVKNVLIQESFEGLRIAFRLDPFGQVFLVRKIFVR